MKNNSTPKKNYVTPHLRAGASVASRVFPWHCPPGQVCGEAIPNTAVRLLRREELPPRNDMFTTEVAL